MHISRRSTVFLIILAIFIFGGLSIYFSFRNDERIFVASGSGTPKASSNNENQPAPELSITLENFKRSETRRGKKLWEIEAAKGTFMPGQSQGIIEDSHIQVYRDSPTPLVIKSKMAAIELNNNDLDKVEATGGVIAILSDPPIKLTTESAVYTKKTSQIHSTGEVFIEGELFDIRGIGMSANLADKKIKLEKQVRSVIKPRKEPS